jgi:glycosyltransferase involved in cell wall biosynthesis
LTIAREHDVWLLTSHESEADIKAALADGNNPRLHPVLIDPFGWVLNRRERRKEFPWSAQAHYYAWQIQAYFVGRALHRRVGFDAVHHVTFGRYYSPSFLSLLSVPFIWGPVGGAERAPWSFWPGFGARGIVYESIRSVVRTIGELDPFVRATARRSALARGTTPQTAARLHRLGATHVEVMHQSGLTAGELDAINVDDHTADVEPPFFLSVTRLLPWKGLHLSIAAFARARLPDTDYRIVGWGPDDDRLRDLSARLGVDDRIVFVGELSRREVFRLLSASTAFVHPSLHDSGGHACLEAMAASKPVICLDLGGPAQQVTPATGFIIPASHPEAVIAGIAEAMHTLRHDEGLRTTMGIHARERAAEFNWNNRARVLFDAYESVLASTEHPSSRNRSGGIS